MPKNKKSNPRFSKIVSRSGSSLLDLAKIRSNSSNLADEIPAAPLSGVNTVEPSPVTPLLMGLNDEDRWTENTTANVVSTQSQPGIISETQLIGEMINGSDNVNSGIATNKMNTAGNVEQSVVSPVPKPNSACRQTVCLNAEPNPVPNMSSANPTKPSYTSFFTSLPRCAGTYIPRDFTSSQDNPVPPLEIVQEGKNIWQDYLVGFFLDSIVPYDEVREHVRNAWKLRGGLRVHYVNGLFYFKFTNMEERRRVLESDPAIIGGKPFIITTWSTSIESVRERVPSISVWAIFTWIPSALQTLPGLNWLASRIGKFKCFDTNTEARKNLVFAKAMIEITPCKPLPKKLKVSIDGYDSFVDVKYSWQPDICTKCQSFGHLIDSCKIPSSNAPKRVKIPLQKPTPRIWAPRPKEAVEKPPQSKVMDVVENSIIWNEQEKAWHDLRSDMRYDPTKKVYYLFIGKDVSENRCLHYNVKNDDIELITDGQYGIWNKALLEANDWDRAFQYGMEYARYVPNLPALFAMVLHESPTACSITSSSSSSDAEE